MIRYPIAKPHITDDDKRAVMDVLDSGILSLGPKVHEFEQAFARHIGTRYACAVSSGTAGLHIAMITAGIGPGDEVITTPFSFVASANCILYVGAMPVFVDIDPVTYNLDPKKIEAAITNRTKAILPVHIFGQPAEMDMIMKIAKKHSLVVIEDACESIGATYKGKQVGTFGQSAVFAFYPNKQMTTGEGGMLVTNSKRVYDLACTLRNQGRAEDMQWLEHERLGYNYRMDEMSAALGVAQLERLPALLRARQDIAGWYEAELKGYVDIIQTPQVKKGNTDTWFVYVILLKSAHIDRDSVIKKLAEAGVSSKPYLPSIHMSPFYKKEFQYKKGDFPTSESVSDRALALPLYMGLTKRDISTIVARLIRVLSSYAK